MWARRRNSWLPCQHAEGALVILAKESTRIVYPVHCAAAAHVCMRGSKSTPRPSTRRAPLSLRGRGLSCGRQQSPASHGSQAAPPPPVRAACQFVAPTPPCPPPPLLPSTWPHLERNRPHARAGLPRNMPMPALHSGPIFASAKTARYTRVLPGTRPGDAWTSPPVWDQAVFHAQSWTGWEVGVDPETLWRAARDMQAHLSSLYTRSM